ncbi:MAG: polyphosphate kinase 1 [Acidimicrobiia bacterium]|nr:polyphosphate kinase 1 [Acidimicrobiia bacterium]NNL69669.1 polyphosphate kinase 1 [Acidimicrobiia bacterium]
MAIESPLGSSSTYPDLYSPELYINRELSWLQFNLRVLEEALDPKRPLFERIKFLSIFSSNLDEFFMIRVSGLRDQLLAGALEAPADGMTPAEQLAAIRLRLQPQLERYDEAWSGIIEELTDEGVQILLLEDLKKKQRKLLRKYFESEIFPALTPLAFDPSHPFPHISNLSVNLAVVLRDPRLGERFARVKVPHMLPRLLRIPSEERAEAFETLGLAEVAANNFVWIEEVVHDNLDLLFPGVEVVDAYPFRVTRDADVEIEEDEAADLLTAVSEGLEMRQFGSAVRLEIDASTPDHIRDILIANLDLAPYQVFATEGPLGMADLMDLMVVDRPDLKEPPIQPRLPPVLQTDESIFSIMQRRDVLLYHPYDSFTPVVDFIREAARDPQVVTIKQTLYRIGANSPIVDALLEAREKHKQVAVLVELKARFDETTNIEWARALEEAGVHVVYGVMGLKTHAKLSMVVRRDPDGLRRYVHMSSGNYNVGTSRIYTDIGLFTTDPDIGADVSDVFNSLTGYSRQDDYRKLLVAPNTMREELEWRIEREIAIHETLGTGHLAFKMNALIDRDIIAQLYAASQAGVKIDLQVRGICALRPGVPGVSDNITVTSIVGRYLEHARIYYFGNGDEPEIFVGSADLMPRNLNRRVEVLYPVENPDMQRIVMEKIFKVHLADNVQARYLRADGTYKRRQPAKGEPLVNSQIRMIEQRDPWLIA